MEYLTNKTMGKEKYRNILNGITADTQPYLALRHMLDFGSITSLEAFTEYGISRLSAIIYVLRNQYDIPIDSSNASSLNRYGKKVEYAKYFITEED